MDTVWIDVKTYCGTDGLPALEAGCAGIYIQSIVARVAHNLKDMGMPAHEDIRLVCIQHRSDIKGIMPRRASDMSHQNLMTFAVEELHLRTVEAYFLGIAVPVNAYKGLECGDAVEKGDVAAEISGMPYLIDRSKEFLELGAEYPVGV